MQNVIRLKRQLTPREVRRLKVHQQLPSDSANLKIYENEFKKRNITFYSYDENDSFQRGRRGSVLKEFFRTRQLDSVEEDERKLSELGDSIIVGSERRAQSRQATNLKMPELIPMENIVKVMIVLEKMDSVFKSIASNCGRLNYNYVIIRNFETALEIFNSTGDYQLVIVDTRKKYNDSLVFGEAFRVLRKSDHTVLVAVLEPGLTNKEIPMIISLLDVGYDRCIPGTPNGTLWCSELRQINASLIKPQSYLALQTVLYHALNTSHDPVIITDQNLRIQYANYPVETLLNMPLEEVLGMSLQNLTTTGLVDLEIKIKNLRTFEGVMKFDQQEIQVRACPMATDRQMTTHVIIHFQIYERLSPKDNTSPQTMDLEKALSIESVAKFTLDEHNLHKVQKMMESAMTWDFDIFELEKCSLHHPLLYLGMELFARFNVFSIMQIDEQVCKNWLSAIEVNYYSTIPYHNSTHGADVMQAASYFLQRLVSKGGRIIDPIVEACVLIASAAHDVGHPGKSSPFLVNSDDSLAILYNDITVLESHHAALTFKLTLNDPDCNIFKNLDRQVYRDIRGKIIDMILATDMAQHFEHLAKFIGVFGDNRQLEKTDEESNAILRRMLIKCADVSSPLRPIKLTCEWAVRITAEYLDQTEEEKTKGLPILMPMFDRDSYSVPGCQIGFYEFIILKMMQSWDDYLHIPDLMKNLRNNLDQWKEFDQQKIYLLEDIKKKQEFLLNLE